MKKLILTLTLLFFHFTLLTAQWEIINEGLKGWINTVDFIDENVGWIGGGNGTLLKTTDGGETWINLHPAGNWSYDYIDFISETIGWATSGSSVLKTSNGGANWYEQIFIPDHSLHSIFAVDPSIVYTVSDWGIIMKTTNGGAFWFSISQLNPEIDFSSIWFKNAQVGVITGSYDDGQSRQAIIRKTTNGGTNWIDEITDEFNSIYDLQFLNELNGYFRAYKDTSQFICKTNNMFESWVVKTVYPYSINSFQPLETDIVYAVMSDSLSSGNVMKSVDGGINWNKIFTPIEGASFGRIYFNDFSNALVLGSIIWAPALFRSTDAGITWDLTNNGANFQEGFFSSKDYGIISAGYCYCFHGCWSDGEILSTMDGGDKWAPTHHTGKLIKSFVFIDDNLGYWLSNCSSETQIYKTTSGGTSWSELFSSGWWIVDSLGYNIEGNDMEFMDENLGFVVGKYLDSSGVWGAGILYTTNGGDDWDLGWQFPDTNESVYNLNEICFSGSTGWTIGESGIILKYTPQTGWVQQTSATNLPLNKVFFSDENNGWIAGGYQNENDFQKILLKTNDGGVNWDIVPNVPFLIKDIWFLDSNLGWGIGYTQSGSGGILKTTNGGNNWVVDTGNLSSKLNAIFIKDNYGWAVGENGLILRNTDAGTVWVEDENDNSLPTEFVLEQNFPNPFNPVTKILYSIPSVTLSQSKSDVHVTLKVYDVIGRKVATLVDEKQTAGIYTVEFNSKNLSSGIYFYQLKADEHIVTKKMLLLK